MNKTFVSNLKKYRLAQNLTQEKVAELLGVTSQTVSRWECGQTLPDALILPQIARIYAITVDDLYKDNFHAYDNYAQRMASVYDTTCEPEDFIRADAEFKKLIKKNEYSLEDCRLHGTIYLSMLEYCKHGAVEKLNHIINEYENRNDTSPQNQIYWKTRYLIIRYYIEIGQSSYVCKKQEERLKNHIDSYMEWSALIYAYYHTGIFDKAYDSFLQAKEKFSDKWIIYDIGSNVCRVLKKYDEAIECCDKSLEYGSEFLDSLYSKAFCFEEMQDYKSAYDTWIAIIEALKKDGYDIEAESEEKRAKKILHKIKQSDTYPH